MRAAPRRHARHRPGRESPAVPEPANCGSSALGYRARQLHLDPATLAEDLARIGLLVPVPRLNAILAGDEPAPAVVLAGLVETLELRDPTVGDHRLITTVARPWLCLGWPVPAEILTILATARKLSVSEVRAIAAVDAPAA